MITIVSWFPTRLVIFNNKIRQILNMMSCTIFVSRITQRNHKLLTRGFDWLMTQASSGGSEGSSYHSCREDANEWELGKDHDDWKSKVCQMMLDFVMVKIMKINLHFAPSLTLLMWMICVCVVSFYFSNEFPNLGHFEGMLLSGDVAVAATKQDRPAKQGIIGLVVTCLSSW